jgi:hypothetical protein
MSRFILLGTLAPQPALEDALVRAAFVANARFACNDAIGRKRGDPIFEEVVEGRQKWSGYSSCADLYAVADVMQLDRVRALRDWRFFAVTSA